MPLFGRKEKKRPKSQPPLPRQGPVVNSRQNRASINVPTNPDTRPLPEWWIEQYDPHYSRFFYVDTRTEHRQWEHPDDLPPPPPSPSAPAASLASPSYRQYPFASQSNYRQQPYNAYPPQQGPYQTSYQAPYATNQPNVVYATQPPSRRNRLGLGGLAGGALGGAALGFLAGDLIGGMGRGGYGYGYGGYGGGYEGGGGWNDGGFGGGGFDGGFNGGL